MTAPTIGEGANDWRSFDEKPLLLRLETKLGTALGFLLKQQELTNKKTNVVDLT